MHIYHKIHFETEVKGTRAVWQEAAGPRALNMTCFLSLIDNDILDLSLHC